MNHNEKPEIFRGHFEECLRHFGTRLESQLPKKSKGAAEAKQPIATFCGVQLDTLAAWFYHDIVPTGETRLKVMCYLDLMGYRIIELERMPKVRRNFVELVGFSLLTSPEATELLGYVKVQTFYGILNEHRGTTKDREQKMWEAWKSRREALTQQKEKAQELYCLDLSEKSLARLETAKGPAPRQTAVVSIMQGLLTLLDDGAIDGLSESEIAHLRLHGGNTILQLSARLSALSSKLIMSDQPEGGD